MNNYLGEFPVDISTNPYVNHTPSDWAMEYIAAYGQIDGAHHKQWLLDQVVRILKGTPVIIKEARWENHAPELRFNTDKPSKEYIEWVMEMKGEGNEEDGYEYGYDSGIAP